jgi:uncharacterized protein (DUF427 family)
MLAPKPDPEAGGTRMAVSAADHPIAIQPEPRCVRVLAGGQVLAETKRALSLREASYPPVLYIPRDDARMDFLRPSSHRTHCPHKGEASYFSICLPTGLEPDAVWSYESPLPAVAEIAGHLAFYPSRVDAIEIR